MYTIPILQSMAAALTLWLLWRFCQSFRNLDPLARRAVTAGFLLRAFGGLAAFWISFLRLPVARSLQVGDGFWFYALDGRTFVRFASVFADQGLAFVLSTSNEYFFTKFLSLIFLLIGETVAAGLLINLFCYLGTAWFISRLGPGEAGSGTSGLALLLFALSPTLILWSTQPLKDSFFGCTIVAMIFLWQRTVRAAGSRQWAALLSGVVAIFVATFVLAGIRPYYPFIIFVAGVLSVPLYLTRAPRGRGVAVLLGMILILGAISQATIAGSGRRLQPNMRIVINPLLWFHHAGKADLVREAVVLRSGFEMIGGSTRLYPGDLLQPFEKHRGWSRSTLGRTLAVRLITGAAASLAPRFVAAPLLIHVGGGRGMWAAADADTIYFTLALTAALALALLEGAPWRRPDLFNLELLLIGVAVPLFFVVSNFGSLLRLRGMVLILALALIANYRRPEVRGGQPEPASRVPDRHDQQPRPGSRSAEGEGGLAAVPNAVAGVQNVTRPVPGPYQGTEERNGV